MMKEENAEVTQILDKLRMGNERAFNRVYQLYFDRIYRKVYTMVKEEAVADELVQELFLRVWQRREEIDPQRSFNSLVYTIAANLVNDHFRKVALDQRLMLRLIANATTYYLHSDRLLENKESQQILMQAIDQLSPQRKLIFTLCKLDGKSYEEVSQEVGISVATVNTHMTQSLKIVRNFLIRNQAVGVIAILVNTFERF